MLRITEAGYRTVSTMDLDGKLIGPWVEELRRTIGALRREDAKCLNLAKLSFADAAGVRLLHALRSEGVVLTGAPPLIEALMAAHADAIEKSREYISLTAQ